MTLDEIAARADAATAGPWEVSKGEEACGITVPEDRDGLYGPLTWDDHGGEVFNNPDAVFIAAARTDVPRLVAVLRAVEAVEAPTGDDYTFDLGYAAALDRVRNTIREALGS